MNASPEKPNKKVFVSGNFFVLHPGHIRLLKFASECGDRLYVGVNDTRPSNDYPTAQERAEILKELGLVHEVIVLSDGLESFLAKLKPDLIVKGKEYEGSKNPEQLWVDNWGGKLLFAAGDASYSGSELLRDSYVDTAQIWHQPKDYIERHNCNRETLLPIIDKIKTLRVAVVGDLIIDEYIQCEALGMSREDPTLVVSPQESKMFLGGAGIVSAHCRGIGASVHFYSVLGRDNLFGWTKEKLSEYHVTSTLIIDESRPTTLKQRYRVGQKTMMRVSHLRQHEISMEIQEKIYSDIKANIGNIDCLIFSDFNYGVLPQPLVRRLIDLGHCNNIYMAADSQTSSQMGDITRFYGVNLVTPTEHEARIALRDQVSGLHVIARELVEKSKAKLAILTLGEAGSMVINENYDMDRLPSLNTAPEDVSGAGDSMLVGIALAKTLKLNDFQAAYIGSLASAIQVGRLGNVPINISEMKKSIQ